MVYAHYLHDEPRPPLAKNMDASDTNQPPAPGAAPAKMLSEGEARPGVKAYVRQLTEILRIHRLKAAKKDHKS